MLVKSIKKAIAKPKLSKTLHRCNVIG